MPLKRSEAFVIDVRKLAEADRLVVLYTEVDGKLKGVARSAARSLRRFGGKLERLSRIRVRYFEKEGRDLCRIDSCDLLEESITLHQDLQKAALLSYIAEIVDTFGREREADPPFFRLLGSVINSLRDGGDEEMLARYFEVWTLKLHGLFPQMDICESCGGGLAARGASLSMDEMPSIKCPPCGKSVQGMSVRLSAGALDLIRRILTIAPGPAAKMIADRRALADVERAGVTMLNHFMGHPFRSYRFLKEVREL